MNLRLALARTAARGLRALPWRWRVAAVLAAMRAMAWRARKPDGAFTCTACNTRLGGFIADYGAAPASRLLGIAGTANNPRLYGGAVRQSCPVCLEAERTRFLLWVLAKEGVLDGAPIDLLVCSGGPALLHRLRAHRVVSANYARTLFADTACDLRAAPFAEGTFDAVICAYVLSYIDDDRAALSEIFRVLRPGGVAWLVVPQDLALASAEEGAHLPAEARAAQFGNACHMRLYGMDFDLVLAAHGFRVATLLPEALVPPAEIRRLGLQPQDRLYRCTKP